MALKTAYAMTSALMTLFFASEAFSQTHQKKMPANHPSPVHLIKQQSHTDTLKTDSTSNLSPYAPPIKSILPHSSRFNRLMMAGEEIPQATKKPESWNFS